MRKPQRRSIGSSTPSGSLAACWKTSSLRTEAAQPAARGRSDFLHDLLVGPAGGLQDVKGVVGALEPVHLPPTQARDDRVHQPALAKRVPRAVQAEHRNADLREMSIAQLFRPPSGMQ